MQQPHFRGPISCQKSSGFVRVQHKKSRAANKCFTVCCLGYSWKLKWYEEVHTFVKGLCFRPRPGNFPLYNEFPSVMWLGFVQTSDMYVGGLNNFHNVIILVAFDFNLIFVI